MKLFNLVSVSVLASITMLWVGCAGTQTFESTTAILETSPDVQDGIVNPLAFRYCKNTADFNKTQFSKTVENCVNEFILDTSFKTLHEGCTNNYTQDCQDETYVLTQRRANSYCEEATLTNLIGEELLNECIENYGK